MSAGRQRVAVPAGEQVPSVRRADAHPDAPPRRPIRASEDLGPPLPIVTVSVLRGVPELEQPLPRDLDQPLAAFDPVAVPFVAREPVRAVAPLAAAVVADPPLSTADYAWAPEVTPEPEPAGLSFLAIAPDPVEEAPAVVEAAPDESLPPPIIEAEPGLAPVPTWEAALVEPAADISSSIRDEEEPRAPVAFQRAPAEPAADMSISSLLDRLERGARKRVMPEAMPEPAPVESLDDTLVMLRRLATR
jgi:hypothetical protein